MNAKHAYWVITTAIFLSSCATDPASIVIHDTPLTGVWLTPDPQAASGHKHPYTMTPEAMTRVLNGVQVEERDTLTGLGILGSKEGKPAFSQAEIARLSPYLVEALRKASSHDMATFYMVVGDANRRRAVTSGGLFVDDQRRLHLMLANWRSVPSGGQDYTRAMEVDTRDEPLLPVSPYRFRVGFHPAAAWIRSAEERNQPSFPAYRSTYADPAKAVVIDLDSLAITPTP